MQNASEKSLLREWLKWMNKKELALIIILLIFTFFLVLFSSTVNAISEASYAAPLKIAAGSFPAVSESGKIAYVSTKSGVSELYVYDSGKEIKLTNDIYAEFEPSFYNEESIIYISLASGAREIWKVNLKTLRKEQITSDAMPKYFPRANKRGEIAYVAGFYPEVDIYLWKNGIVERLTDDRREKYSLAWSRHGDKLAFIAKDKHGFSIFLMNLKDKSIEKIAENVYHRGLSLSDDRVVFVKRADNGYDIYEKELKSGRESLLLHGISDSWEIDPSLSQSLLAFSTDKNGRYEIYVIPLPEKKAVENEKEKEAQAPLIAAQPLSVKAEPSSSLSSSASKSAEPEVKAEERAHKEKSEETSKQNLIEESEIKIPEKESSKDEIIISGDEQEKENIILAERASKAEKKEQARKENWLIFILLSALSFLGISYLRKKEKTIAIALA